MNNSKTYIVSIADTAIVEMDEREWLDYQDEENSFYQSMLEDNDEIICDLDCGRVYYCDRTGEYRAVSWATGEEEIFTSKQDAKIWLLEK